MPTLKEIKGRIASVRNTLKITSAMKLVSSAKLRKAQKAIEAMRPYQLQLQQMLSAVSLPSGTNPGELAPGKTVIVAIASNSSLCGGFNANAIAKLRAVRQPEDIVYPLGRKMADTMRRDGFIPQEDFSALIEHPSYEAAAALADRLAADVAEGRISKVLLVYNHFVSTARQQPVVEQLLPLEPASVEPDPDRASDIIIEPDAASLRTVLEAKSVKLNLYAALLDSAAAEHAARTVAMQTATDNAEQLLSELTLQYNKGRQQKITTEILDLAGGQVAG